ncbi:dienelactone hydrolase family protein [Marinimicrobium sp. ABcell2]|uniref:dienelactone hydrolase family protein n=1 Tax=Marinimicrobium sp. ABcell2 TaxID=3069751 RepID=UPI0027B0F4B8|nr:dienelactone hydrolase family protein [Marinimicrobium sp. ABcell2]MDQ2075466.1 dienelactone hydrolase family protein [Marinimicrobium sp. ABcell2]
MNKIRCFLVLALLFSSWARAELVTEEIEYEVDGERFTGYLAYNNRVEGERPGILLVHEWWGHNDYVRRRAELLAELGYTAFALDMYGSGKEADHPEQANEFMEAVMSNIDAAERRFHTAHELLRDHETVSPTQTAALGYCFGGAVVLHMARQGADLDAVISYHGMLSTDQPASEGDINAKVRVFTGGADPMVPEEQVEDFKEEMRNAGVDYEVYVYEDAVHSFTNPDADEKGERFGMPLAYDAQADADSWRKTFRFLYKVFN